MLALGSHFRRLPYLNGAWTLKNQSVQFQICTDCDSCLQCSLFQSYELTRQLIGSHHLRKCTSLASPAAAYCQQISSHLSEGRFVRRRGQHSCWCCYFCRYGSPWLKLVRLKQFFRHFHYRPPYLYAQGLSECAECHGMNPLASAYACRKTTYVSCILKSSSFADLWPLTETLQSFCWDLRQETVLSWYCCRLHLYLPPFWAIQILWAVVCREWVCHIRARVCFLHCCQLEYHLAYACAKDWCSRCCWGD